MADGAEVTRRPEYLYPHEVEIRIINGVRRAFVKAPEPPPTRLEKLLDRVIDATFMKRGFNPQRHRKAILAALDKAGYEIRKK